MSGILNKFYFPIMYLEKLGAIKSQAVLQMEKENKKEENGGLIRDILKKLT